MSTAESIAEQWGITIEQYNERKAYLEQYDVEEKIKKDRLKRMDVKVGDVIELKMSPNRILYCIRDNRKSNYNADYNIVFADQNNDHYLLTRYGLQRLLLNAFDKNVINIDIGVDTLEIEFTKTPEFLHLFSQEYIEKMTKRNYHV